MAVEFFLSLESSLHGDFIFRYTKGRALCGGVVGIMIYSSDSQ